MDPLAEQDALQEAQVVEVVFDPTARRLGLLFDLRQALQLRLGNTGLITFEGVEEFSWSGADRATPLTAWTVVGSVPELRDGHIRFDLFFVPDGELHVLALGSAFYVGDVAHLPPAPPDFIEATSEEIAVGMPSFGSPFEPAYMTRVDPAR
jgi:hypothetical protein